MDISGWGLTWGECDDININGKTPNKPMHLTYECKENYLCNTTSFTEDIMICAGDSKTPENSVCFGDSGCKIYFKFSLNDY